MRRPRPVRLVSRLPQVSRFSRLSLLSLAALAVLAACNSLAVEPGKGAVVRPPIRADEPRDASLLDTPDAARAPEPVLAETTPLPWGTRPPKDGILFPVVDGMCIHGEVFALEDGALFAYGSSHGAYSRGGAITTVRIADDGLTPQPSLGFGEAFGFAGIKTIGGHYPDRLWAIVDVSSRMVEASQLHVGTAKAGDWKVVIDSGTTFGEPGTAATPNAPVHDLGRPLAMQDGSTLIPEMLMAHDANGAEQPSFAFRLLSPSGALVAKPKVPGPDLAKIAFQARPGVGGEGVVALASGEVLGLRRNGDSTKLVRWSPAQPVDDLTVKGGKTANALRAGKTRAFVQIDRALFVYEGTTLEPVKLTSKLASGFVWAVGADDTLYVALPGKTLLVETAGAHGTVTEEPMPAFGRIEANAASRALWLVSDHARQLHRRSRTGPGTAGSWDPVLLPAPPFGNALRGPVEIEALQLLGADDVFVNTRRIEKGWGWSQPEPYRAIYRTKRPSQVLRCQDVRGEGSGRGVHAWPPAADDACTTPFVVVMREETKEPARTYPGLAAKLRGKTEYGDTLSFVSFEGRGALNLGIPMSDTEKARRLATYLSRSLDLRADVVCGRPEPTRQLAYDVVKGTLAVGQSSASH
jgi:hypothetical protein